MPEHLFFIRTEVVRPRFLNKNELLPTSNRGANVMLHYAKIAFINLLILFALLLLSETIFRTCCAEVRPAIRTFPDEMNNHPRSWARQDPDLGWVFNASNDPDAGVNLEGFRAKINYADIGPKSSSVKRIVVLGDSFTFGAKIDDAETLTYLLGERLGSGYEVYNLASPGWGVDQMYLAYNKFAERIDPDIVIVVYIDDDIWRVFESFRRAEGLNKPSFRVADGHLISRKADRPGALEWIASTSMIFNKFYNTLYKHWECQRIAEAVFDELLAESRQRNQKLIALRYPYREEFLEKGIKRDFDLQFFFRNKGILYLDPYTEMVAAGKQQYTSFYLATDNAHPAKGGNAFIADFILRKGLGNNEGPHSRNVKNETMPGPPIASAPVAEARPSGKSSP
jgi:hypothetical protein